MYARYYLKATMVRDWKWDYDVKHHITVNAELDLNAFPEASLGGRNQDHKNLCCLCCKLVSQPSSSYTASLFGQTTNEGSPKEVGS